MDDTQFVGKSIRKNVSKITRWKNLWKLNLILDKLELNLDYNMFLFLPFIINNLSKSIS